MATQSSRDVNNEVVDSDEMQERFSRRDTEGARL